MTVRGGNTATAASNRLRPRAPKTMLRSRFVPVRLVEGVPVEILRFIPVPDHRPVAPASAGEPASLTKPGDAGSLAEWFA
jgi:hypothetical protein